MLVRITYDKGKPHYYRIGAGTLKFSTDIRGSRSYVRDLMRVAWHLQRTWGTEPVSNTPEPPQSLYGEDQPLPGVDRVYTPRYHGLDASVDVPGSTF